MIQIGMVRDERPVSIAADKDLRTFPATVVYIHPLGRYYMVEFKFGGRTFRESRFFSEEERDELERAGIIEKRQRFAPPDKSQLMDFVYQGLIQEDRYEGIYKKEAEFDPAML